MSSSSSDRQCAFEFLMSNANKRKTVTTQTLVSLSESETTKTETLVPVSELIKPKLDDMVITTLKSKIGLLKNKPNDFKPENISCWKKGERVPFLFMSLAFDLISTQSSRNVITDILCNMLRTVIVTTPEDLIPTVYIAANEIAPAYKGIKLSITNDTIVKAISEAFGTTESHVNNLNEELGDLGLVAKGSRSSQTMIFTPKPLTVVKVFDTFKQIAKESGTGTSKKKKDLMKALLVAARDCEPLYLTRLLEENLRIGIKRQTVLSALGQAAVYKEEPPSSIKKPLVEAAKIVKEVYSVHSVYDVIVDALLSNGVWNLAETCSPTLGIPVKLMDAKPVTSLGLVFNKFKETVFTCEYKYDGERAQVHCMEDGRFEIFSKHAERNTAKFPDVALALSRLKKPSVKSFILDCEVVAFDKEKKKLLPLQILRTRANNVNVSDIKVEVCIFGFDMLYLNGKLLIQDNLNSRREKLYDSFDEDPGCFQFASALTSSNIGDIEEFLNASTDNGYEGLMIKTLYSDATYEPAKRTNNWFKLKKDYMDTSIGDSLDLVPIGAFHGRRKRTGVFGAFLLACYDVDKEEFQSICKIGTGFSEAELQELSLTLSSKVIATPKQYYRVDESLNPHVWFEPTEVWEVKAAKLTNSSESCAAIGIVYSDKGISLRSPRLVRLRKDKKPEEATTSDQIAEMYQSQKHNQQSNEAKGDDD